jgi:hypothetical protein
MAQRSVLRRLFDLMMATEEPLPQRKTITPETKKRLEDQVRILSRKIAALEASVADATRCGIEVPDSVCQALYDARRDRRARVVVLNRINEGFEAVNA